MWLFQSVTQIRICETADHYTLTRHMSIKSASGGGSQQTGILSIVFFISHFILKNIMIVNTRWNRKTYTLGSFENYYCN